MTEPTNSTQQQIKCPHCGQTYAVRPEQWAQYSGRTINCTRCGQAFTVAGPQGAAAPMAQAPPAYGQPPAYPSAYPPGAAPAMQPPVGYASQPYSIQPATTSGWAIGSLVCGILSFCTPPIGNILAIVFGIIGLNKTRDPRVGGKGLSIAGICLGCVSFVLVIPMMIAILLPALNRAREQANRVKCASNMRQIGQVMAMYANANGEHFPDKLEDLLQYDPSLSRSVFVCPSDDKVPPSSASLQAAQQEIASGKNCSYVYLGGDLTAAVTPDTVLLYEPLTDHQGQGMNVMFGDFRVEWLARSEAQKILDQQAGGNRPIKYSPGP